MPTPEILAFLRRQRFGVISSIGEDGEPQAAVVGLAFAVVQWVTKRRGRVCLS